MSLTDVRTLSTNERICQAAASLLLEKGARRLRTAEIAERAGVTESTLFRSIGRLSEVLPQVDKWAWGRVTARIQEAAFEHPAASPRETLLCDTEAIWAMRHDDTDRIAAAFAFLFYRRKHEFGMEPCTQEVAFARRSQTLCAGLQPEGSGEPPELVATLLMNYLATVWLTWEAMAADDNDPLGVHDLSSDEAQLGVLLLLERSLRPAGSIH